MTNPIFLFSLPRSGSTLLQRMLSLHPDVESHSELWFLLPHIEALINKYSFSSFSNISLNNATKALLDQLPEGDKDYYKAIRALSDSLYDSLAKNNEKYVLDKTPRYYLIIDEIHKIYPDAKYIFLFRNPLSVAASIIESFNQGRLGDYRHKIDLFLGPKLLADGYSMLKEKSHVTYYEDLVTDPVNTLRSICDFLGIEFVTNMVTGFSEVPVGKLGDQFGTRKLKELDANRIQNWQKVFSTSFRKRYLIRYIENIGKWPIESIGYKYEDLISQVESNKVKYSLGILDRADLFKSEIITRFELMMFVEKYLSRHVARNSKFLLH